MRTSIRRCVHCLQFHIHHDRFARYYANLYSRQTYLHNRLTNEFGCRNYCLKAGEIAGIDGDPPTILAAVIVHEGVIADGRASSGRYAKVKASERALAALEELSISEFREQYGCDCKKLVDDEPLVELGTAI